MEMQRSINLLLFFGLVLTNSVAECDELVGCTCEPIVPDFATELCRAEYNRTVYPNKVNSFSTGVDALKEFSSIGIDSLITQNCSPMLTKFLCSYYFPPCLESYKCEGIGPCDSLCEEVRSGCEPILLKYNFTWPDHLSCSKFPSNSPDGSLCIPGEVKSAAVTVESSCENVTQPICASLHTNYLTQFPNKGLITQDDANLQFNTYIPALNSNCSSLLKLLLCMSHFPACLGANDTNDNLKLQVYPCKHLCKQVRRSCEPFLIQNNASWPDFLDCSHFPNKSESICADSTFTTTSIPTSSPAPPSVTTLPNVSDEGICEPILPEVAKVCGSIHPNYTMTHFPHGQFTTQREAIDTLLNSTLSAEYMQLINANCAAELRPFLCLHFFPMCSSTQPITVIKPCRNVCRKARTGCEGCLKESEWHFDCKEYQVHGTCLNLDNLKAYLRQFSSTEKTCKIV